MFLEHSDYDDHETVVFRHDVAAGLRDFIAMHSTCLGPAIGGCRMLPYASSSDAVTDVLRLSRGMTYKCALAGVPYGGGKAVIIGDPRTEKTEALLHAMGDFVDELGGKYITSFDSGTTLDDVRAMGLRTPHVGGILEGAGNASASTARGIFICIGVAAQKHLDASDVKGLRVAIQGAGNVGSRLADMLVQAGAIVTIADIDTSRAAAVAARTGAAQGDPDRLHTLEVDVLAPCALGGFICDSTIKEIRARIIAGGANNQLAQSYYAEALTDAGILYCPDYLTNAGGIVDLHYQRSNGSQSDLEEHLHSLGDTLAELIGRARATGRTTADIADEIVVERLESARGDLCCEGT